MFGNFGLFSTKHWTTDQMPDQTNRVHIVTGANTGIGYETAKALLAKNAKVYVACRSSEKAHAAIERLKSDTGKEALFLCLDLADLKAVRKAVEEFQSKEAHLDVLFNNAGLMATSPALLTANGYELQFGTNVLGHFHLTTLLLPQLLAASPPGRVINVSSEGHRFAPRSGIDFGALKGLSGSASEGIIIKWKTYGQSKLGNILFSNELARRYGPQGLVSIAVHPGGIATDLGRHQGALFHSLMNMLLHSPTMGAVTQLYTGTAPEARERSGKYFVPWGVESKATAMANNVELSEKLWKWCEEELKNF